MKKREPDRLLERVWGVSTRSGVEHGNTVRRRHVGVAEASPEFVAFYNDSFAPVARALAMALGDEELGSEAADEAMARCYSHWGRVRTYDNPAGWVYRVGLNWGRSLRRKLGRRRPSAVGEALEPAPLADPEVHRALLDLDVGLRAVVVCRFFLDWSVGETAAALGIPEGTVKSRTHKALELLERKLYHLSSEA